MTVVGCEPHDLAEGLGPSAAVRAAVPAAVELVLELLARAPGSAGVRREEEGR